MVFKHLSIYINTPFKVQNKLVPYVTCFISNNRISLFLKIEFLSYKDCHIKIIHLCTQVKWLMTENNGLTSCINREVKYSKYCWILVPNIYNEYWSTNQINARTSSSLECNIKHFFNMESKINARPTSGISFLLRNNPIINSITVS